MNLSKDYIYRSPLEETLNNMYEFDENGRIGFSDIMKDLKEHSIYETGNRVGSLLKTLAPEGKNLRFKTTEGIRYYKLKYRLKSGTQDLPF